MDAASLDDPQMNINAPMIAILYDENKIDTFKGQDYTDKKTMVVNQWSDQNSNNEGFIILLPLSDFMVCAKQGETKIWVLNYIELGKNNRPLETAFSSILHISLSPEHKVLTVFDRKLTALIQFFVPEIECPNDPLIKSCSGLFLNKQIECVENAVWNMLDKQCFCIGGYFLDINTRTCKKCSCLTKGQYCNNSATDCFDTAYYEINLNLETDVTARACFVNDSEQNFDPNGYLQTLDGKVSNQLTFVLRKKNFERVATSTTILESNSKRGDVGLKCINNYYDYSTGSYYYQSVLAGGRTLSKIVPPTQRWYDDLSDTRFLELPMGPFDLIEKGMVYEKGIVIIIAGSSYSYDPLNKQKHIYRFYGVDVGNYIQDYWVVKTPQLNSWILYKIGDYDPSAMFITPQSTYVCIKQATSDTQVFSNNNIDLTGLQNERLQTSPLSRINTRIHQNEVTLKINMLDYENY